MAISLTKALGTATALAALGAAFYAVTTHYQTVEAADIQTAQAAVEQEEENLELKLADVAMEIEYWLHVKAELGELEPKEEHRLEYLKGRQGRLEERQLALNKKNE